MRSMNLLCLAFTLLLGWAGTGLADEASVRQAVETRLGVKVDEVARTGYGGLYEVRLGEEFVYTDEKVSYLLVGNLIDPKTRENVTETRKEKLATIRFDELPLDSAIKTVRGNGHSTLAVFADPNCGFCKRMERELVNMTDVTIYTFLYPILDGPTKGDSIRKSKAIWCAKDRSKAWFDLMLRDVPPVVGANCDTAVLQRNLELGQKLIINGTPTSFVRSGQRIVGARSIEVRKAVEVSKN
jgi:thiol:disulfide interchange protein DsbC